ncbi:MAG: FG-GAP repeat domain-containing protein, partial [Caldimicrobium sp.]
SEILKYTSEGLKPVIKNLNLILQFVDYAGTGEKDTLLAQTFDSDNFWGKDVYIVKREGTSIRYVQRLEVPENFRLIGSDFADLDGDGIRELITYLPDGRLGIFKNNKLVFSTPFSVTKHFYQLTLGKGKRDKEVIKVKVSPLPNFIVKDFNGDGHPDILIVKADFPLERIAKDLKTLPLNQGTFQFYLLSYQGTFYFRALPIQETGIFTGVGAFDRNLYFSTIKGIYPGQTESVIYSILY